MNALEAIADQGALAVVLCRKLAEQRHSLVIRGCALYSRATSTIGLQY